MSVHTPGPWKIHEVTRLGDRSEWSEYEIWTQDCDVLVATEVRRQRRDGGLANVRLIAAAPDLLEELEGSQGLLEVIIKQIEAGSELKPDMILRAAQIVAERNRTAIAKARGRAA